ncbi:uncharacterized protein LOC117647335, partial [Thrips palmi]|uniref:Uncharacterized protein LOC117647335 n=1 Tax=Thrips palmi TaxID=161013 RepID=A0A6P8Z558_THRPL
ALQHASEADPLEASGNGGAASSAATIAILEASFSARDAASIFLGANRTCGANHTSDGPRTIRAGVNHRCSGQNYCSFILNTDLPSSADWGPGLVHIKYACVSGSHMHRYCSSSAEVTTTEEGEGFLQSPGYPTITVGQSACLWRLRANRGQRLLLRVLDLSLRARTDGDEDCVDALSVREGSDDGAANADLVHECGDRDDDLEVESEHGALDVNLTTRSENAFPSRGVLIHYKAVGCPTLPTPVDGYLEHHNATAAWYMCSVGYVFKDTERRARTLLCEHGNTWNDTLAPCVNVSLTSAWKKGDFDSWTFSDGNNTKIKMAASDGGDNDTVSRVIVPTVIMAMLFVGNAVVLYVLFMLRKRNQKKCAEDEERAAIVKTNGSIKETKVGETENALEENTTDIPTVIANGAEDVVADARC